MYSDDVHYLNEVSERGVGGFISTAAQIIRSQVKTP